MAEVENLKVGSVTYDIRDANAAHSLNDIAEAGDNIEFVESTPITDFTVHGTPTISNGTISNFSATAYLTTYFEIDPPEMTTWEIVSKFKYIDETHNYTKYKCLLEAEDSNEKGIRFSLTNEEHRKLLYRIENIDEDNLELRLEGITEIESGVVYYSKIIYDSSEGYKIYLSTDGINWNLENEDSTLTYPYPAYNYCIGNNYAHNSTNNFEGEIYLDSWYAKVNDEIIWKPYENINKTIINSTGDNADLTAGRGISIFKANYNGTLQKNTTIDENGIITCTDDTRSGLILPDSISEKYLPDMTTFDFYVKAFVKSESWYSSGYRLFSLLGDNIWVANRQSKIEEIYPYSSVTVSSPIITEDSDVWFKVSKSADGKITIYYKKTEEGEWLTALASDNDYSNIWIRGPWILGTPERPDRKVEKDTKFYLPECYLEINGEEVWRGSDLSNLKEIIAVNTSVLVNNAQPHGGGVERGVGIESDYCTSMYGVAVGAHSVCNSTGGTVIGYNAKATEYMNTTIGYSAKTNSAGQTVLGAQSSASRLFATALGFGAHANAIGSIQLGAGGTNTSAGTLAVCLAKKGYDQQNYTLLRHDGKIPVERLAEIIITGPYDPTEETKGTLGLLYKNTSTGRIFKCTNIEEGGSYDESSESDESYSGTIYTWSELLDASNVYTKEEVDELIEYVLGDIETRLSQV